jgi:folate-binding protein YgfZ
VLADPYATATLIETAGKNSAIDEKMWHEQLIIAGIAEIQSRTAGLFTPHALNYPKFGAVSLTKGCYIGQEIIARMHYRGQSKEQCFHIDLIKQQANNHAPTPGDVVNNMEGKILATIVDGYFNTEQQVYTALAVMQSEQANTFQSEKSNVMINNSEYVLSNCRLG